MPEGPEMTRVKQNDIDWYSNSSTRIAKRRQLERHGKTDRRFVNVPTNRQALPAHLSSNLGICCNVRQNAMGLETPELVTAAVYRKRQENMVQINSNVPVAPVVPVFPWISTYFNHSCVTKMATQRRSDFWSDFSSMTFSQPQLSFSGILQLFSHRSLAQLWNKTFKC